MNQTGTKHTKQQEKKRTGRTRRLRPTVGRLGKQGLTLLVLIGVFFSLFGAALEPVAWAAELEPDTAEDRAAESPAPLEQETYPVRLHLPSDDGEEVLELAVPAGGSVASALGGAAVYDMPEDGGADWTAAYDWYTLDEAGAQTPYDLTAEVTAALELYAAAVGYASATTVCFYAVIDGQWTQVGQKTVSKTSTVFGIERYYLTLAEVAEIYGAYGFAAEGYQGQQVFPHLDSAELQGRIWADALPRTNAADGWWIPLGGLGRASNSVYYTPCNVPGYNSYFTDSKRFADATLLAENNFYSVSVADCSDAITGDLPETRYILNGQPFSVTLPLSDAFHWVVTDPLTGEVLALEGEENAAAQTVTYTVAAAGRPYCFTAYSNQKVVVYKVGLAASLVDLSSLLAVSGQSIVVDGSVRGSLTYLDPCAEGQQRYTVLSPDNDRGAVKTISNNAHSRRFVYRFTGWRVGDTELVVQPGRGMDLDELSRYMDPVTQEITLTAVWTPFADNTTRIETVNFFVSLNCEIADNMSNGFASQPQSNFTDSLAFSRVRGAEELEDPLVIAPPQASDTAYVVDGELRKLTTTPYKNLSLETFPSDEAIFEAIRNGGYTINIGGVEIDKQYLTSAHFTIRWYVLKYEESDGFHIDGVLVAREGRLVVKKTFAGDADAIAAVKDRDFYISVKHQSATGNDETLDYDLSLLPAAEETREGFTGYTSYDPDSDTYSWTLLGRQEQTYHVQEHNAEPTAGVNYTARYAITNSAAQTGGWVDDPDGKGVYVTVASYASDVPGNAVQTVALQNIYVKAGLLTVAKLDGNTGNGLRDVAFRLRHESDAALVLYRKPGTNEYTTSEQEEGYTERVTDNIVRSGPSGYFYIKLAADGRPYTLEETIPSGYYGPETIRFTVDGSGTVTSLQEDGAAAGKWASGLGTKMLTLKNESRLLTEVTARKNWGTAYEREKRPVTVALYRNGVKMVGQGNDEKAYEAVLSQENGWRHTWTDLPLFVDGQAAQYSLRELRIGDVAYDPAIDDGYDNYLVTYDQPLYSESATQTTGPDAMWEAADGTIHYADHVLLVVNNEVLTGVIAFAKVSDSGAPVSGAVFTLYTDPSCTEDSAIDTATSNDDGFVRFDGRVAGVYYLKETAAPRGFALHESVYRVTIHAGKAHITLLGGTGGDVHQIVNESSVSLTLEKYSEGGARLTGAVFTLRRTGDVPEDEREELETAYTVGTDGAVVMADLASGDYELRETAAPQGYRLREETFRFRISNGRLSQLTPYPDAGWRLTEYGGGRYVLTVTDEALPYLPATGGRGAYGSAAAGMALLCAAMWLLWRQKSKHPAAAGEKIERYF